MVSADSGDAPSKIPSALSDGLRNSCKCPSGLSKLDKPIVLGSATAGVTSLHLSRRSRFQLRFRAQRFLMVH